MQNLRLTSTPTQKNTCIAYLFFLFQITGSYKTNHQRNTKDSTFVSTFWYVMHLCSKLLCKCTSLSVSIRQKWLHIFNVIACGRLKGVRWLCITSLRPSQKPSTVIPVVLWTRVRWKAICPFRSEGYHIIRDHIECWKMNKTFRSCIKRKTLMCNSVRFTCQLGKESGMHDLLQEKLCYFNYISAVLLFRGIDHGLIISFWLLDLCGGCALSGCNYKKLR